MSAAFYHNSCKTFKNRNKNKSSDILSVVST